MRIMPRARYWKNSMNNHVILKGVDVEEIKVIHGCAPSTSVVP